MTGPREPAGPPDTSAPARRRRALGLVGVALLLLLFSAFLLRPQSEPAPAVPAPAAATSAASAPASATTAATGTGTIAGTGEAPTPTPSAAGDAATGDGSLAAPTVTAAPKVGAVEFTWSYAASRSTDTFRVHVGPTAADAEIADPVSVTKATYTVKSGSGSAICLVAVVVRSGQSSSASTAVCGTAR